MIVKLEFLKIEYKVRILLNYIPGVILFRIFQKNWKIGHESVRIFGDRKMSWISTNGHRKKTNFINRSLNIVNFAEGPWKKHIISLGRRFSPPFPSPHSVTFQEIAVNFRIFLELGIASYIFLSGEAWGFGMIIASSQLFRDTSITTKIISGFLFFDKRFFVIDAKNICLTNILFP